jgi:hypothetical protein
VLVMLRTGFLKLALLIFSAVQLHAQQNPLFKLLTPEQTGVEFINKIKETETLNVLSYEYFYNGGGVAVGDLNNDGLADLYFTANMKPDKLYLNLGNLKFKDITKTAGINAKAQWKTGVTFADVNADGFLDIYVCVSGNAPTNARRNQLYINNGDLTFTEKAKAFGLDDPSYSTQAAFFDYDRDGDLDMYLVNHNIKDFKDVELPSLKNDYDSLAGDKLYNNTNGFFSDVSKESGITGNPISFGLGISISDINNDGWPDIYVSNDYRENDYLYINNKGTFTNKINEAFGHISEFSMGNDIADINNDGLPDLITLDMLPPDNRRQKLLQGPENYELHHSLIKNGFHYQYMRNMLQLNNGDGTFSEIGQLAGVSNTDWSWSPLFADFDNDGNKDLFISNGYLRDYTNRDFLKYWGNYIVQSAIDNQNTKLMDLVRSMPSTLTKNYVFRNAGHATFADVTDSWGLGQLLISSGAAYADLDNDGDLDLILNNVNETASIYRNISDENPNNNYLNIQLTGRDKNKFGLGAVVELFHNSHKQMLQQMPTRGYQSSVSEILHFGLGADQQVDSLFVIWPDGSENKFNSIKSNQLLKVATSDVTVNDHIKKKLTPFFVSDSSKIDFKHHEIPVNDFKRQPLMPFMYSHTGPILAQGDVNHDGLNDLFIGASAGQASSLMIQHQDGTFDEVNSYFFESDKNYSATDATFFDADQDGDLDLYVVSGMYDDLVEGSEFLNDRLFINDGEGFFLKEIKIPTTANGKSCVRICDYDKDGDNDIFLGGRVIPGKYPKNPKSYILQNDGKGNFTDVTNVVSKQLQYVGMVTDALWIDLNKDGFSDLVLVGELMPVTIFINTGKSLEDKTLSWFGKPYSGFWNTIKAEDTDQDGDVDLIVGNLGTNTQLKASVREPLEMAYKDFDSNGSIDPFMCFYIQGRSYPYVTRDELLDQIYPMRKKFTSYQSYADATLEDIFSPDELKDAAKLEANILETVLFENRENLFTPVALPLQAQYSPVNTIQLVDINDDKKKDILLFGNNNYPRLKLGKLDANYGMVFLNAGSNQFIYQRQTQSGLCVKGDVKDSEILSTTQGEFLILGVNNKSLSFYKINPR